MKKALTGVLIVVLVAASAACTSGGRHHDTNLPDPKGYNAHFGDMDKNGDGLVELGGVQGLLPAGRARRVRRHRPEQGRQHRSRRVAQIQRGARSEAHLTGG